MEENTRNKVWRKVWDDPNIIYAGGSVLLSLLTLIGAAILLVLSDGPWWQLLIAFLALSTNFGVLARFYDQVRKLTKQLETRQLPVCFAIGRTVEKAQDNFEKLKGAITELTAFSAFEKIEGFNSCAHWLMPLEREYLPPDMLRWKNYIVRAIQDIRSFSNGVKGNVIYHVALDCPASMAIGLGTVFGTKYSLVCYQFNGTAYEPVLNLMQSPRRIKEHLPPDYAYRYFKISYPEKYTSNVAIVLQAAGHVPTADVRRYLQAQGTDICIIEVNNTYGGNLTEQDWVTPVRELISIFNNLAEIEAVKNVHLFYTMPVALGFGLGMALGQFKSITLYNWEKEKATYYPVLKLNEIGVSF